MHLSKIELTGFKSFPQKVELQFHKGITAIVGPNGSGKSNIVDAVRWVLGEQSAKSLRGTKMEDVIFSGTEERKPLGYCEVGLTLDNYDGGLNLEFGEVTVTRRVYRSGEGEYFINRNSCRLKDIINLFRDTGIGTEGYSVIGQGKVDEILSTKSDDRRSVFEEAAGVTRYKARKDEAERKLEHTRNNLMRLEDILSELELQINTLSVQSETARQYLALRDELRDIELNLFLRQYESMASRMASNRAAREQLEAEHEDAKAKDVILAEERREKNEELRKLEGAISQMQRDMLSLSSAVEKQDGETRVLLEKAESLLRENIGHNERLEQFDAKHAELEEQRERFALELSQKRSDRAVTDELLKSIEEELRLKSHDLTEMENAFEARKAAAMEYMNRAADARSSHARLSTMSIGLAERKTVVEAALEKLLCEEAGLKKDLAALQNEHERLKAKHEERVETLAENKRQHSRILNELGTFEHTRSAKVREADMLRSRINVLGEMRRDHEGYYESVRRLLGDAARDARLGKGMAGVVGDIISAPPELVVAVESALGAALQNIVTEDEESAKRAIEHLRANKYGRATFLPITAVRGRSLSKDEQATLGKGTVGVASELIKYDKKFAGIIENLLGRTVIVEDMDCGIALARKNGNSFKIVTLGGDLINVGGSMTGGSLNKGGFSLLGREEELKSLGGKLSAIEKEIAGSEARKATLQKQCAECESQIVAASEALHEIEVEIAAHSEKLETVELLSGRLDEQLDGARLEIEQICDNQADIEAQLAENSKQASGEQISQEQLAKEQMQITQARIAREAVMEKVTEQKVAAAALERETAALEANIARAESEKKSLAEQADRSKKSIAENNEAVSRVRAESNRLSQSKGVDRKAMDEQLERIAAAEQSRDQLQDHLQELERRNGDSQAALAGYVDRLHRLEMQYGKTEIELANLQERIWDDYELTYEGAGQYRSEKSLSASANRTDELKTLMRELGDVNVAAIEDYRSVKERFDNLTEQKQDLEQAEKDLCGMIAELMKTMESLFLQQFELINENFGVVFKQLFGGGKAELRLSDKKDVLGCDIEIIAQPPGKRLVHLSLLSGGEKALTAITLLFAMLKLKATPFCLLDEIEASLDEANVVNFANYIKQYAHNTQFILITHRKGSMEVCDTLYGVAMEEKGVSRLVSVKLSDYAKHTA